MSARPEFGDMARPRVPAADGIMKDAAVETGAAHGEELFSAKVKAGSRTYFMDVQRAAKLWNLSVSDLAEIQRSLKELQA
jgi:hypothetical protein